MFVPLSPTSLAFVMDATEEFLNDCSGTLRSWYDGLSRRGIRVDPLSFPVPSLISDLASLREASWARRSAGGSGLGGGGGGGGGDGGCSGGGGGGEGKSGSPT
jgi:hypothetical protein